MNLLNGLKMAVAAAMLGFCAWIGVVIATTPISTTQTQVIKHYVRIAAVYEGDIDFRFYITTQMLEKMAPQMINKPLLLGHDWANPNVCVGRVVDSAVKQDAFGHYLEVIVVLNNDETADLIKRDAYHSISIGFMKIKAICMIDGSTECDHQAGMHYKMGHDYLLARFILQEVKMCELSLVNVPASENARVLELATHRLSCANK